MNNKKATASLGPFHKSEFASKKSVRDIDNGCFYCYTVFGRNRRIVRLGRMDRSLFIYRQWKGFCFFV